MSISKIRNIAANAQKPHYLREMARKGFNRLGSVMSSHRDVDPGSYYAKQSIDARQWARSLDEALWEESLEFAKAQSLHADRVISSLPVKLGGGGFYALLYFLTRYLKADTVVETGVAAGYSSRAFLSALEKNGGGRLFSSDFPYFRLKNPEQYIGVLVEPELRKNWTLLIEGDRTNIPKIADQLERIDILHYDSDKSADGREFALKAFEEKISEPTVVLFDDIQDNMHFRDLVGRMSRESLIFEFDGKYIGLILPRDERLSAPGHDVRR